MSNPYQESYWRNHFEAQEQSGLTKTEYCQQQGLALSSFYAWRKKLNPHQEPAQSVHPVTIIAEQGVSTDAQQLTLTLPGGYQLAFSDRLSPDALKRFVEILR